jgi:hypothetical protein
VWSDGWRTITVAGISGGVVQLIAEIYGADRDSLRLSKTDGPSGYFSTPFGSTQQVIERYNDLTLIAYWICTGSGTFTFNLGTRQGYVSDPNYGMDFYSSIIAVSFKK